MRISKVSPQLGKDISKVADRELRIIAATGREYLISKKLDGACVLLHFENAELHIYTREGHTIRLGDFQDQLERVLIAKGFDKFLAITELTTGNGKLGGRHRANGFVLKAIAAHKNNKSVEVPDEVTLNVFDFVSLPTHYGTKKSVRYAASLSLKGLSPCLEVIEHSAASFDEAKIIAGLWISDGYEGAVIADSNAAYEAGKRVRHQIKIKRVNQIMCEIVGYTAGEGKYEGLIGAIIVKDANGKTFPVGSGLSDKHRNSEELNSKTALIQYESISPDGNYLQPTVQKILNTVYYEA